MSVIIMSPILEAQLYLVLAEQLDVRISSIELHLSIRGDLGADAEKVNRLMAEIETEFSVSISRSDVHGMKTVQDILDFLIRNS